MGLIEHKKAFYCTVHIEQNELLAEVKNLCYLGSVMWDHAWIAQINEATAYILIANGVSITIDNVHLCYIWFVEIYLHVKKKLITNIIIMINNVW